MITPLRLDSCMASMRPRPEGRGELRRPLRDLAVFDASMRPRPEGRGEPDEAGKSYLYFLASMRPRPEGRGEPRGWRSREHVAPQLQCGHDPKAVENVDLLEYPTFLTAGFNAATTRRPWRTIEIAQWPPRGMGASMRPRPEGRGEPPTCGRTARTEWRLQCGHDPKAVENELLGRLAGLPQGGFNAATTRRPWRTRPGASRPARPGGFNAATTRRPWRTSRRLGRGRQSGLLQCGHDPKAVENGLQVRSNRNGGKGFNAATTRRPWRTAVRVSDGQIGSVGFNAATTRRPWRTAREPGRGAGRLRASMRPRPEGRGEPRETIDADIQSLQLQCGHDPKAVENRVPGRRLRVAVQASMRPRPEGRGERRRWRPTSWRSSRFNAATTRRPWRTSREGSRATEWESFNAATTRRPWRTMQALQTPFNPPGASMRPRPEGRGER